MTATLDQLLQRGLEKIKTAPLTEVYMMPQARNRDHKVFKEAVGLITQQQIARERRQISVAGEIFREEQERRAIIAAMEFKAEMKRERGRIDNMERIAEPEVVMAKELELSIKSRGRIPRRDSFVGSERSETSW